MAQERDIVVVGGGNSAGYLVHWLKDFGTDRKITVFSEEEVAPYERPALTKAFLHPPEAATRARLPGFHTCAALGKRHELPWYEEAGVELLLSTKVANVTAGAEGGSVTTADGTEYSFKKLIWATGSSARTLSQIGKETTAKVFYVRNHAEAHELIAKCESLKNEGRTDLKAVAIGAGFIGLECAAALMGWGFDVTVIDPFRPLGRILPEVGGKKLMELYTKRGACTFHVGSNLEAVNENSVTACVDGQSKEIAADIIIVGVGAQLQTASLIGALPGAAVTEANGPGPAFVVDGSMNVVVNGAPLKSVHVIGDCAAATINSPEEGKTVTERFETVGWCRYSAKIAAASIVNECGGSATVDKMEVHQPFFYSRCFEYTEAPVIWNVIGFVGQNWGDYKELREGERHIGAAWVSGDRLNGVFLITDDKLGVNNDWVDAAKDFVGNNVSEFLADAQLTLA